jgi:glycosyltransferase involved in cell wall biosynthesis
MRILVCNWKDAAHPRAGGAEVWTHGVARAWVDAGHDVTLATSAVPDHAAREWVDGVEVVRGGDFRMGVHGHARQVYESRGGRFDLVLDEINTRPFGAPRWARRSEVVAFIHQVAREVWFHETPLPVALAGRFVFEPRWLRGYANVTTFTESDSSAASLRAYGLDGVSVLPMGSDLVLQPPREKRAVPTFAFVGRLAAMKRPMDAVRAARMLQQTRPDARLLIVGSGPHARRLARVAGDGVELLGTLSRDERDDVLARSHALLATSVREGWGLVVSEAAAVRTPTIAYAAPGLVDSVRATGGIVVPAKPRALATAMARLAADPGAAPCPSTTGTVPWSEVAAALLERVEVGTGV